MSVSCFLSFALIKFNACSLIVLIPSFACCLLSHMFSIIPSTTHGCISGCLALIVLCLRCWSLQNPQNSIVWRPWAGHAPHTSSRVLGDLTAALYGLCICQQVAVRNLKCVSLLNVTFKYFIIIWKFNITLHFSSQYVPWIKTYS